MYKNKFLIALVVAVLFASCKTDDKLVDEIFATVTRGAIVRTISTEGGSWNVPDDTQTLTLELEVQDEEDGGLLREVRFYASFVDNTAGNSLNPAEVLIETKPASEWVQGEFGLPRATFSISLAEIAALLGGLVLGDYNCGDEFNIRLELELTDGRMWTNTDLAGTVSGGSFFASPLNYRVPLIFLLPSDTVYTGQYNITFAAAAFGPPDYSDGTYAVESIDNVTRAIRSVPTLPAFGGFGPEDIIFAFVCDEIIFGTANDLGAGCAGGAILGGPADVNTTFDVANPDDSAFQINYTSAVDDNGCGVTATQSSISLTKV